MGGLHAVAVVLAIGANHIVVGEDDTLQLGTQLASNGSRLPSIINAGRDQLRHEKPVDVTNRRLSKRIVVKPDIQIGAVGRWNAYVNSGLRESLHIR